MVFSEVYFGLKHIAPQFPEWMLSKTLFTSSKPLTVTVVYPTLTLNLSPEVVESLVSVRHNAETFRTLFNIPTAPRAALFALSFARVLSSVNSPKFLHHRTQRIILYTVSCSLCGKTFQVRTRHRRNPKGTPTTSETWEVFE